MLLQVSVRQLQPYLRAGASPYIARLMLAQNASLLICTHGGTTAKVNCSISHPSPPVCTQEVTGMSVTLLVQISGSVQRPKHNDAMQRRSPC